MNSSSPTKYLKIHFVFSYVNISIQNHFRSISYRVPQTSSPFSNNSIGGDDSSGSVGCQSVTRKQMSEDSPSSLEKQNNASFQEWMSLSKKSKSQWKSFGKLFNIFNILRIWFSITVLNYECFSIIWGCFLLELVTLYNGK